MTQLDLIFDTDTEEDERERERERERDTIGLCPIDRQLSGIWYSCTDEFYVMSRCYPLTGMKRRIQSTDCRRT